jgi:hypothetical protein
MVSYIRIEEYVTLCQQAMKKNTPMEQIEALKRTRKIIRDDLMDHFTYGGLSNNWVQWWWNAVVSVYYEFLNTSLAEMDLYKKIDYDHFMEWVDFLDKSETRYKDVRQERDLLPDLEKRHPKLLEPNYESFPLLPNEEKPTVTTLDMVFYKLLEFWQYSIWRLSRLAAVDGQVEDPEDILSSREYMEYQFINDLRNCMQTSQDKRTSAFKKAVQETNEELFPDVDYDPVQGLDEDFYNDYENDDNYKKVDSPPEEVETIVIHEFDARKVTPLSELPAKLEFYFNTAWKILGINDDGKKYQALGKLYDDIDKENGGYIDGAPQLPSDDIESCILAEKLRLIEPSGKRRETDVLKDYLQRVEKLISEGDDVTNIGGEVTIIDGWDWNPVEGKYPALVILEWLMIKIRKEMRNLHRQASYVEDIPKHKFIVHGHWDFIVNDDDTADWVYTEEQKYVTDDDLDPSPLPKWITGKSGSEESVSNVDNLEVPVTPSKEVKGNNTPDKTEENDLPVISETLTSKYNGQKLLIVYKNLTDKEYLFCTEDAWLYVWGVKVHPTKKTEIKAPTELPRWSAMQGKKTAIGDMIRTLMATDCGKPWKKTAKLFLFSDGSQPVESNLKSYGLQGPSKTEFLKLVIVH